MIYSTVAGAAAEKRGTKKNDEQSHNVIENKRRINTTVTLSHDIYENKWLIFAIPRYV
jgi:hypothetical protein